MSGDRNVPDEQKAQVHRAFDDSPRRFKDRNSDDQFSGASGVLFEQAMAQTRMAICLTDPNAEDEPIVFANRAFKELTGYEDDEIVGRNRRFLQGEGTDPEQVERIRQAIDNESVVVVELLNYRKNGEKFWNALHLGPIYNDEGELIYYFGSQWDVSDIHAARADERHAKAIARELSHRMKNMFAVIGGIVAITGREAQAPEIAATINARIQALGRAYEPTLDEAFSGVIEVGQAIRAVLRPYDIGGERITFSGNGLRSDPNIVATLGIALHELATNAAKHGSLSNRNGRVKVGWRRAQQPAEGGREQVLITWDEEGGPLIERPPKTRGTGLNIIDTLLVAAEGRLTREWKRDGLSAALFVPLNRKADT